MNVKNIEITQRKYYKINLVIKKEFICINTKLLNNDIKSLTFNINELKALNKVLNEVLK